MSDGDYGVAFLNNCLHGYDASPGQVRLSLLRSPRMREDRDEIVGLGRVAMTYAMLPHEGDWRAAQIPQRSYELNYPVVAWSPGSDRAPDTSLSCEPSSVMVTAMKRSEEGDDLVLRLFESAGVETEALVELPLDGSSVAETDMLERHRSDVPADVAARLDDTQLRLRLRSYEIRTVMVSMR